MLLLARKWALAVIEPERIIAIAEFPRYLKQWKQFNEMAKGRGAALIDSYPCLADRTSTSPYDAHYFYQGHWLTRKLAGEKPLQHFDVGSSVSLMGAISAFVETTFIDYRPLEVNLDGLHALGGDITCLPLPDGSIASLSCLHVIEHIGLGRYGDELDPGGSVKAAEELTRVLGENGRLLLSTTVGRERICFNAHRIFSPFTVLNMFRGLRLESFAFVDDNGDFFSSADLGDAEDCEYACGMFEFRKKD